VTELTGTIPDGLIPKDVLFLLNNEVKVAETIEVMDQG